MSVLQIIPDNYKQFYFGLGLISIIVGLGLLTLDIFSHLNLKIIFLISIHFIFLIIGSWFFLKAYKLYKEEYDNKKIIKEVISEIDLTLQELNVASENFEKNSFKKSTFEISAMLRNLKKKLEEKLK